MSNRLSFLLLCLLVCTSHSIGVFAQKPVDADLEKLDGRFKQFLKKERKDWNIPGIGPLPDKSFTKKKDGKEVFGAIIYAKNPKTLRKTGIKVQSVKEKFVTALVDANDLAKLTQMQDVTWVDPGEINTLHNDVARIASGVKLANNGFFYGNEYKGQNVLICIVDTGIDWEHLDFRDPTDPTQSRIKYIWDQTLSPSGGEAYPGGFGYGVEYTQTQINNELDGSPAGFVRTRDTNGHGTHVTGSAAGNGSASSDGSKYAGMAPKADILVVKGGNYSFPSTNIIDALTWAEAKADTAGLPLVVNMSLGSNSGPHDGSDAMSQAIDEFAKAGRAVVVSAGNDGQSNIHLGGTIPGTQSVDFTLSIPSYSDISGSSNDLVILEIWLDSDLDIDATVISPNGYLYTGAANTQNGISTNDGAIYITNAINSSNGDRNVEIVLFDYVEDDPPMNGTWTVRLTNQTTVSTNYHCWFEDTGIGSPTATAALTNGNQFYSLGNSAAEAVIVGAYNTRWYWQASNGSNLSFGFPDGSDGISSFSSYGPTRLGINDKPDIAAPGQRICSSRSGTSSPSSTSLVDNEKHVLNQGTSMAAPVVSGAVALLLQIDPSLDPTTLISLVTQNATQDSYTGMSWGEQWGYGKLDIFACIKELAFASQSIEKSTLVYDQWGSSYTDEEIVAGEKAGLKIVPQLCGQLKGAWLHLGQALSASNLTMTLYSDDGGLPGVPIGESVSIPSISLMPFSWNPIDLTSSYTSVKKDTTYHLVIEPASSNVYIATDNIQDDHLSNFYDGSTWSSLTGDFRMRPVIARTGILLVTKIFLQGGYDSGTGTMTLGINNDLPLTSPYAEDPRTMNSMPSNIVDWVLIQLCDPTTHAVVASYSALLHQSGRIVADDGTTGVVFIDAVPDDYRILFKHRNHVVIASASTPTMTGSNDDLFDFTDSANLYDQNGAVELQTNIWGLWCGDSDGSDWVNSTDYTVWYNAVRSSASGYEAADINLDGLVDQTDYTLWKNNASMGAQAVLP